MKKVNQKPVNSGTMSLVLAKNVTIEQDYSIPQNANTLIIGASGAGKTRSIIGPNILEAKESMLISDPKGSLYNQYKDYLISKGYLIQVVDFTRPECSSHYNPLFFIRNEQDILKVAYTLIGEARSHQEPFWEDISCTLIAALIAYLLEEAPQENQNFGVLLDLISDCFKEEGKPSRMEKAMVALAQKDPESFAVRQFAKVAGSTMKTMNSIVSTTMARVVAEANGVHHEETFTGFKFMAEKIAQYTAEGSHHYLFAYEESYGYMMGDYVRDKDAVTASMMVAEMASYYHCQGMTLLDALDALYEKYGNYAEKTLNLVMPGLDGLKNMRAIMAKLRAEPLAEIDGVAVNRVRDYQTGQVSVHGLGAVGETHIKGSNVLYFELADGSSFIIRPSGTEPKIKIYLLVKDETMAAAREKLARYAAFAETLKDI